MAIESWHRVWLYRPGIGCGCTDLSEGLAIETWHRVWLYRPGIGSGYRDLSEGLAIQTCQDVAVQTF